MQKNQGSRPLLGTPAEVINYSCNITAMRDKVFKDLKLILHMTLRIIQSIENLNLVTDTAISHENAVNSTLLGASFAQNAVTFYVSHHILPLAVSLPNKDVPTSL